MKDFYSGFTADERWLIKECEWVRSLQNIREAQFALGNGYMGTRAVLEDIPFDAAPGTYLAGLYDKMASQVAELVNLPNPVNFRLTIKGGEKLDLVAMDYLEHRRILNMKKAVLLRRTLYQDSKKRRYDYQSLQFLSMHNKHIGVLQIAFTPLSANCVVDINTGIDTSVFNASILTEGRKKHFRVKELGQSHKAGFLVLETLERRHQVVYWSGFYYTQKGKKIYAKDNIFSLKVEKNQTVVFTKIFCIKRFPPNENHTSYKKETFKIFYDAFRSKFSLLVRSHINAWDKLWKRADIVIEGTANIQQNLRFNIYHMLSCANFDYGFSSIGARTLSGEGYRGHIFWDAEIFLMPFYLCTFPQIAKNMLLYRFRRLNKARELAKKGGYKGVKFPWESAYTGEEETPAWAKDIDGTIIKIHTHQMEDHITSNVAYAVYKYYVFTEDEKFMEHCGYEIVMDTARFWTSRLEWNARKKRFEINHVIGPDEFHIDVNNNAFTNMMAKWNLLTAYKIFCKLKARRTLYRKLIGKLNLKEKEARQWRRIAAKIAVNTNKHNIIEQFDGYFKLKDILPTRTDENGIPLMPSKLKAKDLKKTQLVKQADVLMMLHLLSDVFSQKTKMANYNFYMPKTLHKSSLSPSIHSLIACEVGDLNKAYNLFNASLRTDISNLYNNTSEGIHAACLGGTWQAVVFGFGGIRLKNKALFINPRMPRTWRRLVFSLVWKQNLIKLELTNETIKLKIISSRRKCLEIGIFDKLVHLRPNKIYNFKRRTYLYKQEICY